MGKNVIVIDNKEWDINSPEYESTYNPKKSLTTIGRLIRDYSFMSLHPDGVRMILSDIPEQILDHQRASVFLDTLKYSKDSTKRYIYETYGVEELENLYEKYSEIEGEDYVYY